MSLDLWFAFVAAALIVLVIPGPTIALVVGYALGEGRGAALAIVAGVALGDFTAMTLSLLGVGALLAASGALFTALKWIGAAYLVYLGVRLWRAPVGDDIDAVVVRRSPWIMMAHAYAVTALNPKSILFFVAFVPQFMDAARPLLPQATILIATFVGLAALNAGLYALLASRASSAIRRPQVRRIVNRLGGGVLIGAGALAAAVRRTA
ncbi:MAG: LysE family translocator [Alphaproteobacteria bacterium]|nr:LysE family translocator [Alphaproteobacteria bacterium]